MGQLHLSGDPLLMQVLLSRTRANMSTCVFLLLVALFLYANSHPILKFHEEQALEQTLEATGAVCKDKDMNQSMQSMPISMVVKSDGVEETLSAVRDSFELQPYSVGKPQFAVEEAGRCVVGEQFSPLPLISKISIAPDVRVLTFGLINRSTALGLSTCASLLVSGGADTEGKPVVRPYTPISTNAMKGKFELMIKVYSQGLFSRYLDSLQVGQTADFKHVAANVKIQYPFHKRRVGMIVGGTGITPMIQALHAILGNPHDHTQVSMLYGNKRNEDILAKDMLDDWSRSHPDRFSVTHVLSREPNSTAWMGQRGHITRKLVKQHLPAPSESCIIFICGPSAMYETFSGPRTSRQLTGLLADMGFTADQVFKF